MKQRTTPQGAPLSDVELAALERETGLILLAWVGEPPLPLLARREMLHQQGRADLIAEAQRRRKRLNVQEWRQAKRQAKAAQVEAEASAPALAAD